MSDGQTVTRRRGKRSAEIDERRLWLYFSTGKIVDPKRCPNGILAHGHWQLVGDEVPEGEPNAVCECPKKEKP